MCGVVYCVALEGYACFGWGLLDKYTYNVYGCSSVSGLR